jgi:GDP-L-fucose synthase
MNLIEAAREAGVEKFVCIGSVCSYPTLAPTPTKEEDLWNGYPEKTNAPYGIAKRALWTMLDAYHKQYGFKSVYPVLANLYGKGDTSDHVIPDMIRKFKQANREIVLWGSGEPTREFLHVKDAARAIVMLMEKKDDPEPINVGSGEEISIRDLANMISRLISFTGGVNWDDNQPNGQLRRSFDTAKIRALGWKPTITLEEGIKEML